MSQKKVLENLTLPPTTQKQIHAFARSAIDDLHTQVEHVREILSLPRQVGRKEMLSLLSSIGATVSEIRALLRITSRDVKKQ